MKDLEIIILIVGVIFVLCSLFVGKKKSAKKSQGESVDAETILKIKEAAAFQETELKRRVKEIIEEQRAEILSDTEERLSRLSNDKIIAVDEFSNQVLEKIENNNQEVIFLYDMFQKKEEEMKSAMNKLERARRENKELLERLEEAEKTKETPEGLSDSTAETVFHTQADELTKSQESKAGQSVHRDEEPPEIPEYGKSEEGKRREQVLALYRKNKNMREISKQLSMGQGEVQLIIDLYGKGKG